MIKTYILKMDRDLSKDDFERLISLVSKEKKEKICRFYRFEDAQRSLLGDVLARYAICKRLRIKNKDLVLGLNEYGKPVLPAPGEIHFNISHTEGLVVCAIDDRPIGIDVETIKPLDFKIAERFFSRDEYLALLSQPEEMRLKYFYMIWTLKESYIKAEGKGLNIPLKSFGVKICSNSIKCITTNEKQKYTFSLTFLNDATVYAVCNSSGNHTRERSWDINKFMQEACSM